MSVLPFDVLKAEIFSRVEPSTGFVLRFVSRAFYGVYSSIPCPENPLNEFILNNYFNLVEWDQEGPGRSLVSPDAFPTALDHHGIEIADYLVKKHPRLLSYYMKGRNSEELFNRAMLDDSVETLRYLRQLGLPLSFDTISRAATSCAFKCLLFLEESFGLLKPIELLKKVASASVKKPEAAARKELLFFSLVDRLPERQKYDMKTLEFAMSSGSIKIMDWAFGKLEVPLDSITAENAARSLALADKFEALQHFFSRAPPFLPDSISYIISKAIQYGSSRDILDLLASMIGESLAEERYENAFAIASQNGHLKTVEYGLSLGVRFDEDAFRYTLEVGHQDILVLLDRAGCPMRLSDRLAYYLRTRQFSKFFASEMLTSPGKMAGLRHEMYFIKDIEILKKFHSIPGAAFTEDDIPLVAGRGNLPLLRFLHEDLKLPIKSYTIECLLAYIPNRDIWEYLRDRVTVNPEPYYMKQLSDRLLREYYKLDRHMLDILFKMGFRFEQRDLSSCQEDEHLRQYVEGKIKSYSNDQLSSRDNFMKKAVGFFFG